MENISNNISPSNENATQSNNPNTDRQQLKITVVGDGMVGKTCMLATYTSKKFPSDYEPTIFEQFVETITVDDREYELALWDTAGQEDYNSLRILSYMETKCFLLCFAVDDQSTFEHITSRWSPEIDSVCLESHKKKPVKSKLKPKILLIGTKGDRRENEDIKCVDLKEIEKVRKNIGAYKYLECSAAKYEGLDAIFVEAVRSTHQKSSYHRFKNRFMNLSLFTRCKSCCLV